MLLCYSIGGQRRRNSLNDNRLSWWLLVGKEKLDREKPVLHTFRMVAQAESWQGKRWKLCVCKTCQKEKSECVMWGVLQWADCLFLMNINVHHCRFWSKQEKNTATKQKKSIKSYILCISTTCSMHRKTALQFNEIFSSLYAREAFRQGFYPLECIHNLYKCIQET